MAIQKSESIVLRKRDFKETSAIVVLYTREFGKINGIVKGVKRPRRQNYDSRFEPFSHNRIVFYESLRGSLDKISQGEIIDYFDLIRSDLEKTAYASYLIELIDKFTELNDRNEAVFSLLLDSLRALSVIGNGDNERLKLAFDVKLLFLSGFMPRLDICGSCGKRLSKEGKFSIYHGGLICNKCIKRGDEKLEVCRGTVASLNYMKEAQLNRVFRLKVTSGVNDEMTHLINSLILSHTGRNLKSLVFLESIR